MSEKRTRNTDPFMTVAEAAEWCRLSIETIYDRVRRGDLEAKRIGKKCIRIRLSDLETWLNQETARHA